MYKKTHTQAKESLAEPYCRKGSFAYLVPLRDIILTKVVYHIQYKKRKNSCCWPGVFSITYQGIKSDTLRILSSLPKFQI
ncbi:hypothetical protein COE55_10245 [Priestia megaterium]|nr:hypothetical protein COE55_10245 [Priestia megaterium]